MEEEYLLRLFKDEQIANQQMEIKIGMAPAAASTLIGLLQLALSHAGVTGTASAKIGQEFVDSMIRTMRSRGLEYSALVAELGNDPARRFSRPN